MYLDNDSRQMILWSSMAFCMFVFALRARAQTQTPIPISHETGVPAYYHNAFYGYFIEGFDIDGDGNYYFISDTTTTLAVFSKQGEPLYRRQYVEFQQNRIFIDKNHIYLFDHKYDANTFFVLDCKTGNIIKAFPKLLKNRVNSFLYRDSLLVLEAFDYQDDIDMTTRLALLKYNLNGKFLGQINNRYALPDSIYPEEYEYNGVEYLGRWKDLNVFFVYDLENRSYKFWLETHTGQVVDTLSVKDAFIGKSFAENPPEHRKLRNGSIFILGQKEKNVVITEIKLDEAFRHSQGELERPRLLLRKGE